MSARASMRSWAKLQNSAKNSVQKLGKFTHHTNGCNSLTDFENKDAKPETENDANLLKIREITYHTNGFNSLTDFENKDVITGNGNDANLLKIREITIRSEFGMF